jgi:hypothetical protein
VHVIKMNKGSKAKLQLAVGLPFDGVRRLSADLRVRLDYVPRLPIFGFPKSVVRPKVRVAVGTQSPRILTDATRIAPLGRVWGPTARPRDIDYELLPGRGENRFLPRLTEKTVASTLIKRILLESRKSLPVRLEIEASDQAQPGTDFYLRIEQEVNGDLTGCYTVVISIV